MWIWIDDTSDDAEQRAHILPLTMSRPGALAYTGLAPARLRQAELAGKIRGLPLGAHGQVRFQTADLQRIVEELYGGPTGIEFDMDFED